MCFLENNPSIAKQNILKKNKETKPALNGEKNVNTGHSFLLRWSLRLKRFFGFGKTAVWVHPTFFPSPILTPLVKPNQLLKVSQMAHCHLFIFILSLSFPLLASRTESSTFWIGFYFKKKKKAKIPFDSRRKWSGLLLVSIPSEHSSHLRT